jgi:L-amino acid N-acyltransferase YncA
MTLFDEGGEGSGRVRIATAADAPDIQAIYAPIVRDSAISFEEVVPSIAEVADRIRTTLPIYPYFVFEDQGRVLGYAYAGAHRTRAAYRWSADVTVYVHAHARRRGVGRALYHVLIEALALQQFHAAFAGITLPNPGSVALHEALGFEHLGAYREVGFKHGRWHDVGWWRRGLTTGPPAGEPIPFRELPPAA